MYQFNQAPTPTPGHRKNAQAHPRVTPPTKKAIIFKKNFETNNRKPIPKPDPSTFNENQFDQAPTPTPAPINPDPKPIDLDEINPTPQPDIFHGLFLLSFVSAFKGEKSFNETDLEALGLDLKCQEPLLPMLHSVLSDSPLLDHSRHHMPECYSKIQFGNPSEKLSLFTPNTLLFIFYTYPHDPLQSQAAKELQRRQWQYDEEKEEWKDPDNNTWPADQLIN